MSHSNKITKYLHIVIEVGGDTWKEYLDDVEYMKDLLADRRYFHSIILDTAHSVNPIVRVYDERSRNDRQKEEAGSETGKKDKETESLLDMQTGLT